MKFTQKRWFLASLVLGAAGWLVWRNSLSQPQPSRPSTVATTPVSQSAIAEPVANDLPRPIEPPPREPVLAAVAAPVAPRTEVEATQQMVTAHAVLREPRVADPDSAENRMVLQTMVLKALANRPTPPSR